MYRRGAGAHYAVVYALGLAEQIAARADSHWVAMAAGGTEIVCKVGARAGPDELAVLGGPALRGPITRTAKAFTSCL